MTEQLAWDGAVSSNRAFHGRELSPALYELLERSGYDYRQCGFVNSWPEQGCFCGLLIRPGRQLLSFEIYPDEPERSFVEESPWSEGDRTTCREA